MATATLAELMDAMADTIRDAVDAVDIGGSSVQVEPRIVLNPTPPTVDMYPADASIDQELRSFTEQIGGELITVRMRVSTADHGAGQDLLLAMMDDVDALSVAAALEANPTLSGLAADVDVRERSGYITFVDSAADAALLGATWTVVVIKARS